LPEHAPLVRELARSGYEAGASYVDVLYADPHVRRAMIERADEEILTYSPSWLVERYRAAADGGALIMIAGEDEPELLAGLDLTVGLLAEHHWMGGGVETTYGAFHVPNMPTEEVFTVPDRRRADGMVRSTYPLQLGGTIVRDLAFTLVDGKIVDVQASTGA